MQFKDMTAVPFDNNNSIGLAVEAKTASGDSRRWGVWFARGDDLLSIANQLESFAIRLRVAIDAEQIQTNLTRRY